MKSQPIAFRRGDALRSPLDDGLVRVMAVADHYLMVRRPGCVPFVLHEADAARWCAHAAEKEGRS